MPTIRCCNESTAIPSLSHWSFRYSGSLSARPSSVDDGVMLLADTQNIREVIMFPMNQRAEDLLMNAPSDPTNEQLRELHLRVIPKDA